MEKKIDMHIHTNCSDGIYSPREVVKKFFLKGYEQIAITDHDGIDGVEEAIEYGKELGIKVISGVEISTVYDGYHIHMLGYDFDIYNPEILKTISDLKRYREERNDKLFKVLNEKGYAVSKEDVKAYTGFSFVGKPNIARYLEDKGYISSYLEALEPGGLLMCEEILNIKRQELNTLDAIKVIKAAKGKAVLAHPAQIKKLGDRRNKDYWDDTYMLFKTLKEYGLDGVECYHPDHSEEDALKYCEISKRLGLLITRGSDFHE